MKLNQYPQAIAKVEENLLKTTLDLECWQEELYFLNGEIELAIACDADLKNEQMRKAKRRRASAAARLSANQKQGQRGKDQPRSPTNPG
jgi:hypothetical protein